MCKYADCFNVQICKFANVQMLYIYDYYFSFTHLHIHASAHLLFICTSANLHICISNKKSPLVNTRRLLYIFQIWLVTFTSVDRILNVVVMYDYFFEWISTGFRRLSHGDHFWIFFAFSCFQGCNYFLCHVLLIIELANEWISDWNQSTYQLNQPIIT